MNFVPITALLLFLTISTGICENVESLHSKLQNIATGSDEPAVSPLIIGGSPANPGEFGMLVHINTTRGFCGGTLIALDLVVTAAHCVQGVTAGSIRVFAGDHRLNVTETTEQNQTAQAVKVHESYSQNGNNFTNDIALIKLSRNFTGTTSVRVTTLPASANFSMPTTATVAGWGVTGNSANQSQVLLKATVTIMAFSVCNSTYYNTFNNASQLCAGSTTGNVGSCNGDSGGPLLCQGTTLCGIVSFGRENCTQRNSPGVYTKVPYYVKWINDNRNFTQVTPPTTTTTRKPGSGSGSSSNHRLDFLQVLAAIMITLLPSISINFN